MRKICRVSILWFVSFSLLASYAAYGWSEEGRGYVLYYIFLLPLALRAGTRRFNYFYAANVGVVLYGIAGWAIGSLLAKAPSLKDESPFWQRHKYAVRVAPAGGFLYFGSLLLLTDKLSGFAMALFFLPLRLCYLLYPPIPGWANPLVLIPGQYLAIGIVIDLIRRAKSPAGRALGLLGSAVFIVALVVCFLLLSAGLEPDDRYFDTAQVTTLIAVYGTFAALLIVGAARTWLSGWRGPRAPCAGPEERTR